jgi:glycosyltransferase involved in cell wall biosynthesis
LHQPEYSICITNYNTVRTLVDSMGSLLRQLNDTFEVIVSDNMSTDGSQNILKKYERNRQIRLISRKSSRGIGRQIALQNARGRYIISGLDMDDTFRPVLKELIRFYHERAEGNVLSGAGEATLLAPRDTLLRLGGWNNLQFRENWELCRRAAMQDLYRWTIFPVVRTRNEHHERQHRLNSLVYRYIRYRENIRVGHKIFDQHERVGISQKIVYYTAKLSSFFSERYTTSFRFSSIDKKYFIDSREYWPKILDHSQGEYLYRMLLKG